MAGKQIMEKDRALELLQRLSGCKGFPERYPAGQDRYAEVIMYMDHVDHVMCVLDEFDGDFPSFAQFKDTVRTYAEKCGACGRKRWQHRVQWEACKGFVTVAEELVLPDREGLVAIMPKVPAGVNALVGFEVDFIKLALGLAPGSARNEFEVAVLREKYPAAVADIEAGREPDYAEIERVLLAEKSERDEFRLMGEVVAPGRLQ